MHLIAGRVLAHLEFSGIVRRERSKIRISNVLQPLYKL